MDSRGIPMYQHPRMTMMGQSDINSVPGSVPINYQIVNPALESMEMQGAPISDNHNSYTHKEEQQHYNPIPTREEIHDNESRYDGDIPQTTANFSTEEDDNDNLDSKDNDPDYIPTEENNAAHPPNDEIDEVRNMSEDEIKTEVDDDIKNFMETAYETFLKINSNEVTIKEASDQLGRPYSFVYSRYQEFCGNVDPEKKPKTPKKKKKKGSKKSDRKRLRARRLKYLRAKAKTAGMIFQCEDCPAVFTREHTLKTHSRVHTGTKDNHICTACGIVYAKVCQLMAHRIKVHEDALQCPHCDKQYTVIANYKFHVKSHANVRPYICEQCNKGFYSKPKLEDHYRRHTGERPFMCGYCEKTFTTIGNLKCHQKIHGEREEVPKEYKFKCEECGKRFNLRANLTRHHAIHTGIKPYKCNYCPAAFVLKTDLARHDMAHTGNKPFKCTYCDYSCVRKPILEYHMNTHTGNRPYKCDFYGCSAEYARPSTLEKHKEKHRPPPPKTCKVCHEQFPDINTLKSHMMIHPGNRPIPCDQCDKIFYNESTLKRHMHVHMYKPDSQKNKQIVRQRKKNPPVKRPEKPPTTVVNLSSEYQKNLPSVVNLSSEYQKNVSSVVNLSSEYQRNLSNVVNLSSDYQKNLSSVYQVPSIPIVENGHNPRAHSWTVNAEDTNSQQSFPAPAHHSFPTTASQFTNLNAWPTTMDPDELRRRLLNSFQ